MTKGARKEFPIIHCDLCKNEVPRESVRDFAEKRIPDLVCENCGTDLSRSIQSLPRMLERTLIRMNHDNTPYKGEEISEFTRVIKEFTSVLRRFDESRGGNKKDFNASVLSIREDIGRPFIISLHLLITRMIYHIYEKNGKKIYTKPESINNFAKGILSVMKSGKPIKNEKILKNLNGLSIEEVRKRLLDLKKKLILNIPYREDFTCYLEWMVRNVLEIIENKLNATELNKFERLIVNDIKHFSFKKEKVQKKGLKRVQKNNAIITRKFALLPVSIGKRKKILSMDRKSIYGDLTKQFVKIRALKNIYSRIMLDFVRQGGDLTYFKSASVKAYQNLYLHLKCNEIDAPQYGSLTLKERVRRCAFFESFQSVRNAIIKAENIKTIARFLEELFALNKNGLRDFLRGKRFGGQELKALRYLLKKNCFGERQPMSTHYLNDHILHLRNRYLRSTDFRASEMIDDSFIPSSYLDTELYESTCMNKGNAGFPITPIRGKLDLEGSYEDPKSVSIPLPPLAPLPMLSLKSTLRERINSLAGDHEDKNAFIDDIANGFTRKKKRRVITITPGELPFYLLTRYFSSVSRQCTKIARFLFTQKERLLNTKNHDKRSKIQATLKYYEARITSLVGNIDLSSFTDFKRSLKNELNRMKESLKTQVKNITREQRKSLFLSSFKRELDEISSEPCQYVLKKIFKPSFSRIIIERVSFDSFLEYFHAKISYEMRARMNELFLTKEFVDVSMNILSSFLDDIHVRVKTPQFKTFSLKIIVPDVFKTDYENLSFNLSIIKNIFTKFTINDKSNRLGSFLKKGFKPGFPTITFKNRKVILNLPLQQQKEANSKQSQQREPSNVEIGVDLGLKHFAVVSVWDKGIGREISRYFLGQKELIDKRFDPTSGKLVYRDRFSNPRCNNASNYKGKLVHLRNQIKTLQRKKNSYEQRLLARGIYHFRSKYKWNQLRRNLSLSWDKYKKMNMEIVHMLNHFITSIAKYHDASTIKVEDLRWSRHGKKKDVGKFMAH